MLEAVGLRPPVRRPYSAPERVAGEKWEAAADVYSLAAIAYELLTARRIAGPLTGSETLELRGADPLVSRLLGGPLVRALAADPAARYPSALAFARALEAAAEGEEERQVTPVISSRVQEVPRVPGVPKVQPSLVDALDEPAAFAKASAPEAAFAEASAARAEAKPKLRVLEKKREPERAAEPPPEAKREPVLDSEIRSAVEPQRELIPVPRKEPPVVHPPEPELEAEPVLDRTLERGLDREPASDLALTSQLREPLEPIEPIEPMEPVEPMEAMESMESMEPVEPKEPREPMRLLPLAVMLVAGMLVGFVAGYAVGTRGDAVGDGSAAAKPAGAAWSEAKVDPPAATPATAAAPPAVPAAATERSIRGTIVVRSTPARAGVIVDGVWRGRTPLTLSDLTLGRHTIRVAERGYTAESREVTLSAQQNSHEVDVRLAGTATPTTGSTRPAPARPQPAPSTRPATPPRPTAGTTQYTGSLFVDSRPRGARVFVDGRAVGVTPLSLADIPVGARVIRLELPNHRTWTDSKRVVAGTTTRVTGSLEQIP